MTYAEKIAELTDMLQSINDRIETAEKHRDSNREKYGRNNFSRVPMGLYIEQARIKKEIEAADYAFGEILSARCP